MWKALVVVAVVTGVLALAWWAEYARTLAPDEMVYVHVQELDHPGAGNRYVQITVRRPVTGELVDSFRVNRDSVTFTYSSPETSRETRSLGDL